MNFDLLKHPAVNAIISILTAVVVALAAAAGFGAFTPGWKGPKDDEDGAYKAQIVGIPPEATFATAEQLEDILAAHWLPEPSFKNTPIGFKRDDNTYALTGSACNGFGVLLIPDFESGRFTTHADAQTEKWCGERAHTYEEAVGQAFERADGFYIENRDTIYVGKNNKGLRLTRADAPQRGTLTEALPKRAQKATSEQVDQILASRWTTANAPKGSVISFKADAEGAYFVAGSLCNGFGAALNVDRAKATYTVKTLPVTVMGCAPALHAYDEAIHNALRRGNTFYVDGLNVYLGKNGTGLKLTPAGKTEE